MKRIALLLVLTMSFPLVAQSAGDAAKRAKVEQLLDLLHMDRMMDQMMTGMRQQVTLMTNQMGGNNVTPEQKAQLAKFQDQIFEFVNARMGWKAMEPDYIQLYTETYTDEELDGIIAFYKTPIGSAMVAKTPELTQKAQALAQKRMVLVIPEMQKMIQDFARSAAAKQKTPVTQSN